MHTAGAYDRFGTNRLDKFPVGARHKQKQQLTFSTSRTNKNVNSKQRSENAVLIRMLLLRNHKGGDRKEASNTFRGGSESRSNDKTTVCCLRLGFLRSCLLRSNAFSLTTFSDTPDPPSGNLSEPVSEAKAHLQP